MMFRISLLCLALLLSKAAAQHPEDTAYVRGSIAALQANNEAPLTGAGITDPSKLPCFRPQPYATARSLAGATWRMQNVTDANALLITIQHAPIYGVTAEMVAWAWRNMHKRVEDPRTGVPYQMFLLAHPVDHVTFNSSTPELVIVPNNPTAGSAWTLAEFSGTGCSAYRTIAADQVSIICKSRPVGFSCRSPSAQLSRVPRIDVGGLYVSRLTKTELSAEAYFGGFVVGGLKFTFTQRKRQLYVQQSMVYGITSIFTDEARAVNDGLMQMLTATTNGDLLKASALQVLHAVQEVGFFPLWLPQIYAAYAHIWK